MGKAQELIVNERIAPSGLPELALRSHSLARRLENYHGSSSALRVVLLNFSCRTSPPKATLTEHAAALDAIFTELARRGALNLGEYLSASETYLRLALKAQSQCHATLETLAEIKNPHPVAFVQQANIAHGPQQVNNGAESRAWEKVI